MYCSTCGARIPPGRSACDTCGTVAHAPRHAALRAPGEIAAGVIRPVVACPRCHYQGEGISYFSRGTHLAGLVGATVVTAGAMGAGGLVYYLLRRDHLACPRCGRGWGRGGELAALQGREAMRGPGAALGRGVERGGALRAWSILLFVLAVMLIVPGVVEAEAVPLLFGLAAGGGGFALHRAADRQRERRRAELIASLQAPVLQLAAQRGGSLTVTEVAAELGWTLPRAEKVLHSLDDGIRVDSEVTDEGVIVYRFRELSLPPGEEPPRLEA